MEEMEDFLGKYGIGTDNASNEINDEPKNADSVASEDIPEVEEWADEDESFSDGLELLYSQVSKMWTLNQTTLELPVLEGSHRDN